MVKRVLPLVFSVDSTTPAHLTFLDENSAGLAITCRISGEFSTGVLIEGGMRELHEASSTDKATPYNNLNGNLNIVFIMSLKMTKLFPKPNFSIPVLYRKSLFSCRYYTPGSRCPWRSSAPVETAGLSSAFMESSLFSNAALLCCSSNSGKVFPAPNVSAPSARCLYTLT